MDISAIKLDQLLKIESLNPSASFKIGGDKTTQNIEIAGGLHYTINQTYVGTASVNNPDLIAAKGTELISQPKSDNKIDEEMQSAISPFMGVVKSPELPGTRIHLEFAVTNRHPEPRVINGTYVKLNEGLIHFKKFFKVNADSSREPDFTTRFPIIINGKGATRLAVEFENMEQPLIEKGRLEGELFVLMGDDTYTFRKFIFEVNDAMANTLAVLQKASSDNQKPIIFDAMIKS